MKTYQIDFEVREIGAIGVFCLIRDSSIMAENSEQAKENFRLKYQNKFEFRACFGCYEIPLKINNPEN